MMQSLLDKFVSFARQEDQNSTHDAYERAWILLWREVEDECATKETTTCLVDFYAQVLQAITTEEQFERIKIADTTNFQSGFTQCLDESIASAQELGNIEAFYFEYNTDGGDFCESSMFLCEEFAEDHEEWKSEFAPDDVIYGPNLADYFSYEEDLELSSAIRMVANEYIKAVLFDVAVTEIKSRGGIPYPLSFSEHEGMSLLWN